MAELQGKARPRLIGRYELYGEIAHGGMATVHVGRIVSDAGFSRTVAIKRLHPHCARDPVFAAMFIDEARLASRIHHPNVVSTLDVVDTEGELFVVMDFVQGESLSLLIRLSVAKGTLIPVEFVSSIATGMLDGLHAAHEAVNELDEPLGIVHRDVSPQNVLVGTDGIPRLIDFGVAKASGRLSTTREGQLKGKLSYMPPEQFEGAIPDRRGDIYSASVVLWEALTGRRLFEGNTEAETLRKILAGPAVPPSAHSAHVPRALDDVVMRGIAKDPRQRFGTAREMALAIEGAVTPSPTRRIGEWVRAMAADSLNVRAKRILEIESHASSGVNVASIGDGDAAQWRRLTERASTQEGATLKFVPRKGAQTPRSPGHVPVSSRPPEPPPSHIKPPAPVPPLAQAASIPPAPWGDTRGVAPGPTSTRSIDRATPTNPMAPVSVPRSVPPLVPVSAPRLEDPRSASPLESSRPAPPSTAPPGGIAAASALGTSWKETWDGAGWDVILRPVSPTIVSLFAVLVLMLAGCMVWQRLILGPEAMIGLGIGVIVSVVVIMRMVRSIFIRFDPKRLLIEHRPNGRSTAIATHQIDKFIMIDEGPRKDPNLFSVYLLPVTGDSQRVDMDFSSDADARYVLQRLNEMLAQVRGRA